MHKEQKKKGHRGSLWKRLRASARRTREGRRGGGEGGGLVLRARSPSAAGIATGHFYWSRGGVHFHEVRKKVSGRGR